ncbi:MAG TPA: hypothetical protein VKM37_08430, partial [Balneolaceae bacterium]|nr:hypothetical protein [Balneolaceae bacterium]
MNAVIIMISIAALLFGWRLYQITSHFSRQQGNVELKLNLSAQFFVKQLLGLGVVTIFLIALNPVPAGIAIATSVGLFVNLFVSIIRHSIQDQTQSDEASSASGRYSF